MSKNSDLWQRERRLAQARLDNHVAYCNWRFSAGVEEGSWRIDLRKEREGEYGTTVASVRLRQLTPSVFLSEKLFVHEDYRRQGISEKLFNVQKAFLREIGGSVLQAFVTDNNEAQVSRLMKLGWVRGNSYTDDECLEGHVWFYSEYGFVGPA